MILTPHLLLGAVIGSLVENIPLAIILAFLSHYFLDFIPHIEYSIKNIITKNWRGSFFDFLKIFSDFLLGIILIYFFSNNHPIIYVCAFIAIIPDGLSVFSMFFNLKILHIHNNFHQIKIHFLKNKRVSSIWRLAMQALIVVVCILLLGT